MINVTKSYLPEKEKYKRYIDQIFESAWLTNNGKLTKELEKRLAEYLGVRHLILVANGSLALQLCYKALNLSGEVITTPFSFVATTSTLAWEGLTPVFADIERKSFNIDVNNIEPLITDRSSAILPVHVFGNPCEVEQIAQIGVHHGLKVIYDAAHAFDTVFEGQSVLNFGDVSTLSFHATKLFHTIEGGAVITNDDELAKNVRTMINFGLVSEGDIELVGTNAKMNEFEAAMGLCVLDEIDQVKSQRKAIWEYYQNSLEGLVSFQTFHPQSSNNHAYAPILFESEEQLLRVQSLLAKNGVYPRRYFYPSLDRLKYLAASQQCKHSCDISTRVLCLPMYPGLADLDLERITNLVKSAL